ncbi:hypothetical protein LOZ66_002396 [Ophidiomyces ophidiicola]|nr:hypothetical protein LOZ65_001224 [Ophidiomyces ophidiicola]KAI1939961.1 hypothetical protein LOZ66_002396 [Ophidiomyces ophidiicola]
MGLVNGSPVPPQNDRFLVTLKVLTAMSWAVIIEAYNRHFAAAAVPGDARNRWSRQLRTNPLRALLENDNPPTGEDTNGIISTLSQYGLECLNDRGEQFLRTHAPGLLASNLSAALPSALPTVGPAPQPIPAPLPTALPTGGQHPFPDAQQLGSAYAPTQSSATDNQQALAPSGLEPLISFPPVYDCMFDTDPFPRSTAEELLRELHLIRRP